MANGGSDVTNGERFGARRFEWEPLAIVAAINVVVALVNIASDHNELARAGLDTARIEPWVWGFSSAVVVVALAPLIGMVVARWPPARERWPLLVAIHLAAATVFSGLHIAGMVGLRELAYLALPWGYDFDKGGLLNQIMYEWRKDLITYSTIAVGYWIWRNWRPGAHPAQTPAPSGPLRIEVRDGNKVMLLEAPSIEWVEAAGNYVEIHTANGVHTARGTLASFEQRLGAAGFVRIHRSRVVNPQRVASYQPTSSGDVEVAMTSGAMLSGSRRFRAALTAALGGEKQADAPLDASD